MSKADACKCPICGFLIEADFYNEVDDIISCFNCDASLKITSMKPLKLKVYRRHQDREEDPVDTADDFHENDDWSEGYDY